MSKPKKRKAAKRRKSKYVWVIGPFDKNPDKIILGPFRGKNGPYKIELGPF